MRLFLTETLGDEVHHPLEVTVPEQTARMIRHTIGPLSSGTYEIPFHIAELITVELGFSIEDMRGTRAWITL